MARINIVNADNKIDATPQRAYFKLKQTGGPKGEKGDTGAQGPQGATGPQGASASVVVNSTTTLPAGSSATVENIGTPQNVKLNFGIPTGPQGPQGEQGPQGAQGPQGLKGDTGAKGADGAAAKVTVGNTNTGAAGTNAIVENTGSETYAVLNFTIPRGDKGETGPMPDIAQTTGQATDEVMSQKATTDALATKQNTLTAGAGITIASDTVSADTTVLATKADLNDYAPQATTYTKTETNALLAPKLEADVVASLPETGEEGKLYLTPKAYTRQTATGNPITPTVAEGAGVIESFQLDGDTEQQTYTGKNLIGAVEQSYSNYGITNTLESDGAIKCYGKCEQTYFQITRQTVDSGAASATPCNIPAGSYTLSLVNPTNDINIVLRLYYSTSASDYNQFTLSKGNQSVSVTITSPAVMFYIWGGGTTVGQDIDITLKLQLESGSTATSFEKFVGGQPSPSPKYLQAIQTVTGEQVVTVNGTSYPINLGKNLFNKDSFTDADGYYIGGSGRYVAASNNHTAIIPIEPNTTYTVSKPAQATYNRLRVGISDTLVSAGDYFSIWGGSDEATSLTLTSGSQSKYMYIYYAVTINVSDAIASLMLEKGATATTYAPYFTPIELCKLGTYQDYIWKDGEDWKVHKATGKATQNVEVVGIKLNLSSGPTMVSEAGAFAIFNGYISGIAGARASENLGVYKLDESITGNAGANVMTDGTFCQRQGTNDRTYFRNTAYTGKTGDEMRAILLANSGGANVYYYLSTPTDTTITDSALIAQLEAIRTAALETGTNTITNSTASSNLAGDMEITYYGYNPTNRYDKFIWLDLNNNYEQIGE